MPSTRKRSPDLKQESLRQHKATWNDAASVFIARLNAFKPHLIAFKRGLNGRGDPKAGLPTSDIKNPIPNEINSYLGRVSSEFHELTSLFEQIVEGAHGIVQEQSAYSAQRRKPQSHTVVHTSIDNTSLVVEASNPVSRFWSQLSSWFSSEENKHKRLALLKMTHGLFKQLVTLEEKVLDTKIENIPRVLNNYVAVMQTFQVINRMLDSMVPKAISSDTGSPDEVPLSPTSQTPNIDDTSKQQTMRQLLDKLAAPLNESEIDLKDLKVNIPLMVEFGIPESDIQRFWNLYFLEEKEVVAHKKEHYKDEIIAEYKQLLHRLTKNIQTKKPSKKPTKTAGLTDIIRKIKLGEPSLTIYRLIKDAKKITDQIMDVLESPLTDLTDLLNKVKELGGILQSIRTHLDTLALLYESEHATQRAQSQTPKSLTLDPTSQYFTRRLRRQRWLNE